MHEPWDEDYTRGYEWWMMVEAKKVGYDDQGYEWWMVVKAKKVRHPDDQGYEW